MQEIEAASVVDGDVVAGNLILTKHDGSEINAGSVVGPAGPTGPPGVGLVAMPGEVRLWPSGSLPDPVKYGNWGWANGAIYDISAYPEAAANIDDSWNTAMGQASPGAGKFRVPDLRGVIPAGMDAMPVGSARANRVTRATAIVHAGKTGEETHVMVSTEMPKHTHVFTGNALGTHGHSFAGNAMPGHAHTLPGEFKASYAANSTSIVVTDLDNRTGASPGTAMSPATTSVSAGTPSGSVSAVSAGTPSGSNANAGGSAGDPVGSGTAHENMPPTIFVPYIVKLDD